MTINIMLADDHGVVIHLAQELHPLPGVGGQFRHLD